MPLLTRTGRANKDSGITIIFISHHALEHNTRSCKGWRSWDQRDSSRRFSVECGATLTQNALWTAAQMRPITRLSISLGVPWNQVHFLECNSYIWRFFCWFVSHLLSFCSHSAALILLSFCFRSALSLSLCRFFHVFVCLSHSSCFSVCLFVSLSLPVRVIHLVHLSVCLSEHNSTLFHLFAAKQTRKMMYTKDLILNSEVRFECEDSASRLRASRALNSALLAR